MLDESQVNTVTGQALVGKTGVVSTAIRGGTKPGQVRVVVEGIPHFYIAYSARPVPAGASILVIDYRGQRQVDVEPWHDGETIPANNHPRERG